MWLERNIMTKVRWAVHAIGIYVCFDQVELNDCDVCRDVKWHVTQHVRKRRGGGRGVEYRTDHQTFSGVSKITAFELNLTRELFT